MSKKFIATLRAMSALIGTVIGVGIFSVPLAISHIGLLPALILAGGLMIMQIVVHLFYTEVVLACKEKRRFPGLVGKYIGNNAKKATTIAVLLQVWGVMTAYLLVGGNFLRTLLGSIGQMSSPLAIQLGFGLLIGTIVYFGLRWVARLGLITVIGLVSILLLILGGSVVHWQPVPLITAFSWNDLILAYGVLLFSFSGLAAIPEMEDMMKGSIRYFRTAVVLATIIAASLITVFGIAVWAASPEGVSSDAITGLRASMGDWIGIVGAMLGFLSVSSAFMTIAVNTKEVFIYDYNIRNGSALLLTIGIPLILVTFGVANVMNVIGVTGAIFGGITTALVCVLYLVVLKKAKTQHKMLRVPRVLVFVLITMLLAGAVIKLVLG